MKIQLVGFLVALKFEAALKKKETWQDLPNNYSVYSLARVEKPAHIPEMTLKFVKHFPVDASGIESDDSPSDQNDEINESDLYVDFEKKLFLPKKRRISSEEQEPIREKRSLIFILIFTSGAEWHGKC